MQRATFARRLLFSTQKDLECIGMLLKGGARMMSAAASPAAGKLKLYSYPSTPHCYQISPFALKLESWLRINSIPYDVLGTMENGPKGKMPYVEFVDGEKLGDSNVVIPRLKDKYGVDCDQHLTKEQRAVAQAVTRMLEEHTMQIIFWWRYVQNCEEFARVVQLRERVLCSPFKGILSGPFTKYFCAVMPKQFGAKFAKRGLAAHSQEELERFSNDDMRAVSDIMGEGPFLFGNQPTTVDCLLFAMMANFLYLPMHFPQTDFVKKECPNLLVFMDRFRDDVWPDWEAKCATANN